MFSGAKRRVHRWLVGGRIWGGNAMARRAWITFEVIESGEDITLHFEDERFPPIWFNKRHRPTAHAKLRGVLDELELVEEVPDERLRRAS
jgi:hypothetical protein